MKYLLETGLACVLILFSFWYAHAKEDQALNSIQIVTPFWENFTNKDGTGLYFEIVREVYEPAGIRMKFRIVPWKRAKKLIYGAKADALLGEYREAEFLMPRYPLYVEKTDAVYKKDALPGWEGPKSFVGKRLIWLRGYDYHETLAEELDIKQIKWDEVDTHAQAWGMIDEGRADFYMDAAVDIQQYIRKNAVKTDQYEIRNVYTNNVYMEFAKTPRSGELIKIYDQRIPELLKNGRLKQIYEKWDMEFPDFKPEEE